MSNLIKKSLTDSSLESIERKMGNTQNINFLVSHSLKPPILVRPALSTPERNNTQGVLTNDLLND